MRHRHNDFGRAKRMRSRLLHDCNDTDPLRGGGDAVGQANFPAPLALVHAQHDAGINGRVVAWGIEKQEAGAQLGHRN